MANLEEGGEDRTNRGGSHDQNMESNRFPRYDDLMSFWEFLLCGVGAAVVWLVIRVIDGLIFRDFQIGEPPK